MSLSSFDCQYNEGNAPGFLTGLFRRICETASQTVPALHCLFGGNLFPNVTAVARAFRCARFLRKFTVEAVSKRRSDEGKGK